MFTIHDCTDEDVRYTPLQGRFVILTEDGFRDEYKDEKHQLVLCTGGFGCDPHSDNGFTIQVQELYEDGDKYKIDRRDNAILGIAKDSVVSAYREKYC